MHCVDACARCALRMYLHDCTDSSQVAAGGENGFSQAIELASDTLSNVKFVQEKRLISKFFDEISQDSGKCGSCFVNCWCCCVCMSYMIVTCYASMLHFDTLCHRM